MKLQGSNINIIKGIDRIALIVAIIVMIFCLVGGMVEYWDDSRRPIGLTEGFISHIRKEYKVDLDPALKDRYSVGRIINNDSNDSILIGIPLSENKSFFGYNTDDVFRYKKYHVSVIETVIFGILLSFIGFALALFGIRLLSRGIRYLFIWIVDGFKDN